MSDIRITYPINPKLNHDCNKIHIERYTLKEVLLPANKKEESRKAIAITIEGRGFKAVAQPLIVTVGRVPVSYLQIAPNENSLTGILLEEPEEGAFVDVMLGDQDHARHPKVYSKRMTKRIK